MAIGILISGIDTLDGIQASSLISLSGEIVSGIQASGLINMASDVNGMQFAGLLNGASDAKGIQAAGLLNLSANFEGVQASGILNIAKEVGGLQISLVNICEMITGVQIGLVNISGGKAGTQVGLVNIAKESDGPMIGLVNISEDGIAELTLRYVSDGTAFVGYKSGTNAFFSELALGTDYSRLMDKDWNIISSASIGTRLEFKPVYVDLQFGTLNANENRNFSGFFLELRTTAGIKLGDFCSIQAGLSANTQSLWNAQTTCAVAKQADRQSFSLPLIGTVDYYPKWFVGIAL
jgi:hypothetical protein